MGRFTPFTRRPMTVDSHPLPLKREENAVLLVLAVVLLYFHIT
jgi:hypothetical protein